MFPVTQKSFNYLGNLSPPLEFLKRANKRQSPIFLHFLIPYPLPLWLKTKNCWVFLRTPTLTADTWALKHELSKAQRSLPKPNRWTFRASVWNSSSCIGGNFACLHHHRWYPCYLVWQQLHWRSSKLPRFASNSIHWAKTWKHSWWRSHLRWV